MSVLVQSAPYALRDGDWETQRDGLGDLVIETLERAAPGLARLVVARQVLTPVDIEADFGISGGHPLHLEPGLDQWFAWRPLLGYARHRMPRRGSTLPARVRTPVAASPACPVATPPGPCSRTSRRGADPDRPRRS